MTRREVAGAAWLWHQHRVFMLADFLAHRAPGAEPALPGRRPLAGQPVAVKDIIAVAGVPTRCGSPASAAEPAGRDALIVHRLRAAGAEVFAAARLLAVLADQPAPANPAEPGQAGRAGFTVGVLTAQLADPCVTPPVREALAAALAALAGAGWSLRELTGSWLDELRRWEHTLTILVAKEAWSVHSGRDVSGYGEGTRALLECLPQCAATPSNSLVSMCR